MAWAEDSERRGISRNEWKMDERGEGLTEGRRGRGRWREGERGREREIYI